MTAPASCSADRAAVTARRRLGPAALLAALAPLAACASIQDAVGTPKMTPVAYPAALSPVNQTIVDSHGEGPRPAGANSLWRNGARAFFHDQRAGKVGDILTVLISIDDSAKVQNETTANRKASITAGATHLLGLESTIGKLLPSGFDPANAIGTSTNTASDGSGSVNRSEAITLTIAAIVSSVMPNGNLVIEGRQETRINNELRELTVAGIVRPEDITSTNTIKHTQIAEARISYGGRGQVTNVQKVPAGQALVNKYSPF